MEVPPTLPKKKDVLEALLSDSNVTLHLDPRRDGVVVPRWFQNQPELMLLIGLNMPVPIRDLEIDENGVSCTLSFSRTPFWCSLPWSSIFAIVSEPDRRGGIWPEDVPPDGQWGKSFRTSSPPPAKRERPKLTALGPNDRPPESAAPPSVPAPVVGEGAKCGACGTKWIEDQSTCPVCGASVGEMVAGEAAAAAVPTPEAAPSEEPKPVEAPRAKPKLAPAPPPSAPDRPVLVRKKGGRASAPGAEKPRKADRPKAVPRTKPVLAPPPPESAREAPPAPPVAADAVPHGAADRVGDADIPRTGSGNAPLERPGATAPSPGKKTTKRELPPYLRVVK